MNSMFSLSFLWPSSIVLALLSTCAGGLEATPPPQHALYFLRGLETGQYLLFPQEIESESISVFHALWTGFARRNPQDGRIFAEARPRGAAGPSGAALVFRQLCQEPVGQQRVRQTSRPVQAGRQLHPQRYSGENQTRALNLNRNASNQYTKDGFQ